MMRWPLPVMAAMLLPACLALANGTDPMPDGVPEGALPQGTADTCNAASLADLIGQPVTVAEARAQTIEGRVRIYGPNAMVTMDYLARRINIVHDADGIVRTLRCG